MSRVDDLEEEKALRAMHASARRNIARFVRRVRRTGDGMAGNRRPSKSEHVHVDMWHDEVDDFDVVNAKEHMAAASQANADARRVNDVEHRECLDCDALIDLHRDGFTHCACGGDWPCADVSGVYAS